MTDPSIELALARLREGRRWSRFGVDYRDSEFVATGEALWFEGDTFIHRRFVTHGSGSGQPNDADETRQRWSEDDVRSRLGAELRVHDWSSAPLGAPAVPLEFDVARPMPGTSPLALTVNNEDVERVVAALRSGRVVERVGTEVRGSRSIWGRERLRAHPASGVPVFFRTRTWALFEGEDVSVRTDTWDEASLRAELHARPDLVHEKS